MLDTEFPEAAIVAEWSCPPQSLKSGFHADFLLNLDGSGYQSLIRDYQNNTDDNSYFKKDGNGNIKRFLSQYLPWYEETKNNGYISLITGNHDTPRISHGLSLRERSLAYAMFFTMPGVPFMYYGDEIGMRYQYELPTKEGGYERTGSRTPMQWKQGVGMGFSTAPAASFYLPVDTDPAAPSVEAQEQDSASLLNTVKALIRLRRSEANLNAQPNLEILYAGENGKRSFIYRRGSCIIAVNPGASAEEIPVTTNGTSKQIYSIGNCSLENGVCKLEPQSFAVWKC